MIQTAKSRGHNIFVVAVGCAPNVRAADKALDAGANKLLLDPASGDELCDLIRPQLSRLLAQEEAVTEELELAGAPS